MVNVGRVVGVVVGVWVSAVVWFAVALRWLTSN